MELLEGGSSVGAFVDDVVLGEDEGEVVLENDLETVRFVVVGCFVSWVVRVGLDFESGLLFVVPAVVDGLLLT